VSTLIRHSLFFTEKLVGRYRGSVLNEAGMQVVKLDREDAMGWKRLIEAMYDPM